MIKVLFLPSIMVLVGVLNYNIRKNKSEDPKAVKRFWDRESSANSTRRQDISGLPYITVPFDTLPLDITLKDEKKQSQIAEYKKTINDLSELKMLNLIGMSNTDLKELYGPANLDTLSNCDQNYSNYIRTLDLFASSIYDECPDKAMIIIEYCLEIGTDISKTFELAGIHYLKNNRMEQFFSLYDKIPDKESISGKVIINKLDSLKETASI